MWDASDPHFSSAGRKNRPGNRHRRAAARHLRQGSSTEKAMPIKFLINPIAREQGGRRLWNRLHEACTRLGYVVEKDYSLEWTRPEYTVEQAQQAASAWDRVVAVG